MTMGASGGWLSVPRAYAKPEIMRSVNAAVHDYLGVPYGYLSMDDDFEKAGTGYPCIVEMLQALGDEFGVNIPEDDPALRTQARVAAYISDQVGAAERPAPVTV